MKPSFLTIDSRVILTTWCDVGGVERAALLKKAIAAHRVSVGDAVVSDNDAVANHVAKRNAERIYGITYHISSSPYYSKGIHTLGRH